MCTRKLPRHTLPHPIPPTCTCLVAAAAFVLLSASATAATPSTARLAETPLTTAAEDLRHAARELLLVTSSIAQLTFTPPLRLCRCAFVWLRATLFTPVQRLLSRFGAAVLSITRAVRRGTTRALAVASSSFSSAFKAVTIPVVRLASYLLSPLAPVVAFLQILWPLLSRFFFAVLNLLRAVLVLMYTALYTSVRQCVPMVSQVFAIVTRPLSRLLRTMPRNRNARNKPAREATLHDAGANCPAPPQNLILSSNLDRCCETSPMPISDTFAKKSSAGSPKLQGMRRSVSRLFRRVPHEGLEKITASPLPSGNLRQNHHVRSPGLDPGSILKKSSVGSADVSPELQKMQKMKKRPVWSRIVLIRGLFRSFLAKMVNWLFALPRGLVVLGAAVTGYMFFSYIVDSSSGQHRRGERVHNGDAQQRNRADICCAICLESLKRSEDVAIATLPCAHVFHDSCVEQWLRLNSTCPTCRTRVRT